jgi:hypothetical protein
MQETVAEIKTCSAGNQLQPSNVHTDESAQLLVVQLETMHSGKISYKRVEEIFFCSYFKFLGLK